MAESVTITTFLELRDNMSAGLGKVEAALKKIGGAQASQTKADKEQAKAKREQEKALERLVKAQEAAHRRAQQAADRAWRDFQRKEAAKQAAAIKTQAAISRAHLQAQADRRKAQAEQARAEKQRAAATLREQRRVEASQARAAKQQARQQRITARQQEQTKRERADFVGKAGAAMFGARTGGFLAAAYASPMAGLKLGMIGVADALVSGITTALSKAYDLTKAFFEKVYSVSKEYQMSVRRVAGSLVTMDFSPTFEVASRHAEKLYATMRDLAAKLPGETKDYMEVFSLALPQALHAGEQNLQKFTEKVSKFTAFAMFRNVKDINQVARDMERMIMGKAIGRTRMFNEYLAYLQMATNNLKFGVKEFNKMSMPKRLELMYDVIDKSSETFKYMVNDADTLEGTFNTLIDQIMLVGGKPLFEAALSTLKMMNRMLMDNNSKLTETVRLISTNLGDALRGAVGWLTGYSDGLSEINSKTLEITGATGMLLDAVLSVVSAFGKVTEAARKAGEAKRMEEREVELQQKREQLKLLEFRPDVQEAKKLLPAGYFPGGKLTVIPDKPEDVISPAVAPSKLAQFMFAFGGSDQKSLQQAAEKYPRFADEILGIPEKIERRYTPDVQEKPVPWSFAPEETWIKAGAKVFKALNMDKDTATELLRAQYGFSDEALEKAYRLAVGPRTLAGMEEEGEVVKGHKARGAPKGRQTTINDFRFSKFDIRQEFAEGFDPDRIAVAFASDLAKMGEMRMQSAYAPLFAVRGGT